MPRLLLKFALSAGAALMAGIQLRPFLAWTSREVTTHGLLTDDAFFYSVLARNVHRFGFLTMDGEMPTNGVQPLWMGAQILLTRLLPATDGATVLIRSSAVCYILFAFGVVWFAARGRAAGMCLSALMVGGLVVLNVNFQLLVVKGLEVPMTLLLLLATLILIDRSAEAMRRRPAAPLSISNGVVLGIAAALCFLARTDLFWVCVAIGAWLAISGRTARRAAVACLISASVLVLPYLVFNVLTQGSPVPISGRVKQFYCGSFHPTLSEYLKSDEWTGLFVAFANVLPRSCQRIPVGVAAVLGLMAFGQWAIWRNRSGVFPTSMKVLSAVVLGHVAVMQFAYRELRPYTAYYFAPEVVWASLVLAMFATADRSAHGAAPQPPAGPERLVHHLRRSGPVLVALLCAAVAGWNWGHRESRAPAFWSQRVNLAEDIRRALPPDTPIAAFWPGCFAQFSGHAVTPLDGVAGSNAFFQDYVKFARELHYVQQRSRPHVVVFVPGPPKLIFTAPHVRLPDWSYLGLERLRSFLREGNSLRVVTYRPTGDGEQGWYLLELVQGSATKPAG